MGSNGAKQLSGPIIIHYTKNFQDNLSDYLRNKAWFIKMNL